MPPILSSNCELHATIKIGSQPLSLNFLTGHYCIGVYFDGSGIACVGVRFDSASCGNITTGCHFDIAFLEYSSSGLFVEDPVVQGQNTFLSNGSDDSLQNLPCNIAGNLGVGNSLPQEMFEVGPGIWGGGNILQNALVTWRDAFKIARNGTTVAGMGLDNNQTGLQLFTGGPSLNDSTARLTISAAGNIGVGTTEPTDKLAIASVVPFTGNGTVGTTTTNSIVTGDVNTQFTTQISVGDQITIGTQTKTVTAIASDSSLTVDSNWTTGGTGLAYTIVPACTVSIGAAAGGIGSGISMPGAWSAGAMAKLTLGDYNQTIMALWGTGMVFRTYPGNAFVWQDNSIPTPKEYMRLNAGTGMLHIGGSAGSSSSGYIVEESIAQNPTLTADGQMAIYSKGNKICIAKRVNGTTRYTSMDMSAGGNVWTESTQTAP